jgi:hypothetical protein
MTREQNRPGSGRPSQNPQSPQRPGKSETERPEEEEEESGGRMEEDEESSPMRDRDQGRHGKDG